MRTSTEGQHAREACKAKGSTAPSSDAPLMSRMRSDSEEGSEGFVDQPKSGSDYIHKSALKFEFRRTINLGCVNSVSDVGHIGQRTCFFAAIIDIVDFGVGVDQIGLHHLVYKKIKKGLEKQKGNCFPSLQT